MIARATGGFILAMAVILFLFGAFDNSRDLLVAVLVAVAFGALVAWWTRPDTGRAEPGVFDERATRRAVRRGVLRTALVAIVWVLVAATVLGGVSDAWQNRGDRGPHLRDVVQYGFYVGHAGFQKTYREEGTCCNAGFRSLEIQLQAEPRTAEALAQPLYLTLEVDLRGRLADGPLHRLPRTAVEVSTEATAAMLERLPDSLVATAAVEFRSPLRVADLYRLLARHRIDALVSNTGVYLQPQNYPQPGGAYRQRVSWPNPNVAQFQAWVKLLRPGDEGLLADLEVPPLTALRPIAQRPRVYGVILDDVTPQRLRGLLDEPAVRSVRIGDVAFNLRRLAS